VITSRFYAGASIVIIIVVVELVSAFVVASNISPDTPSLTSCANGETANCGNQDQPSFLATLFSVTVSGFDNVEPIFNVLWVTIMGGLLSIGVVLIVTSFLPTVSA